MTDNKSDICLQRWSTRLSVEKRLAELTEFVQFWHDAPSVEWVVAPAAVPDFLPAPLKWLHQITAKYDEHALRSNYGGWIHGAGLIAFNNLKHPSHLQADESGYLEFLNEDQGVCQWATLKRPDDPPVFRRWLHEPPWEPHMQRLSDFLLMLIVFELSYGAPNGAWGQFPANVFKEFVVPLVHVDVESGTWTSDSPISIHHGTDLAVWSAVNHDGTQYVQLASRTAEVVSKMGLLDRRRPNQYRSWVEWLAQIIISRFGASVRHHPAAYVG